MDFHFSQFFYILLLEYRHQTITEVINNKLFYRLALVNLYKFLVRRIVLILLPGSNDIDVGRRIVFYGQGLLRIKLCGFRKARINHRQGYVIQGPGQLGCFQLDNLQVLRIFCNIAHHCFHRVRAFLQFDEPLFFQEEQCPSAVRRIIGDGNFRETLIKWAFYKR